MQQILIYFFMALGLSVDAFSLAIAYGIKNNNKKIIMWLSTSVGIFHFVMPLLGFLIGKIIKTVITFPNKLVGIILILIAIQMYIEKDKDNNPVIDTYISILVFSLSVSIDSLSIGLGLGTLNNNIFIPAIIFAIVSAIATLIGLLLGKRIYYKLGNKATILGIIILVIIAIKYLI